MAGRTPCSAVEARHVYCVEPYALCYLGLKGVECERRHNQPKIAESVGFDAIYMTGSGIVIRSTALLCVFPAINCQGVATGYDDEILVFAGVEGGSYLLDMIFNGNYQLALEETTLLGKYLVFDMNSCHPDSVTTS